MINIRSVFRYVTEDEKQKFKDSRCLLTISVGQEVHENEMFESVVKLVNNAFKSCILLIDDSLQRHTMAITSSRDADFFYEQSIEAGDAWLERNNKYYKEIEIMKDIIRWDYWLKKDQYVKQQGKIKELIEQDEEYKDAFSQTIDAFLSRNHLRFFSAEKNDLERARQLCLDYLIEDCTALCLWLERGCNFEVYPGRRNLAMVETHKRFVIKEYPHLLHPVGVKFKNRKQLKPQRFPTASPEKMVISRG